MNSVDAAYEILQKAGKPLHYADIACRAVLSGLWRADNEAPYQTMKRDIDQEIRDRGKRARFIEAENGIYAAVPSHQQKTNEETPPDLDVVTEAQDRLSVSAEQEVTFVSKAWDGLPLSAKREVLQIIHEALSGKTDEIGDPVVMSILPDGPKIFPRDFLAHDIDILCKIELPEEELTIRQLPSGGYVVESPFGFRHDVRNEPEGMFIVYARRRGARVLNLPEKMIDIFRAVKGYKGYLQTLWSDLYKAYGRRWGEEAAAYKYAKTAFDAFGLPLPPGVSPPAATENGDATDPTRKDQREKAKCQHRVLLLYCAVQCWLRGWDGIYIDRVQLGEHLGVQRFRQMRIDWMNEDFRELFPCLQNVYDPGPPERFWAIRLSRVPFREEPKIGVFKLDERFLNLRFPVSVQGRPPGCSTSQNSDQRDGDYDGKQAVEKVFERVHISRFYDDIPY